ncbi:hypothetical protein [uncultured Sphingomonas sp.]|uniref:hypothetical protein n=1 Tax=uncultured Sphingomonas sp. TaxID=158754 RepID=UPI0035C9B659
MIAGWLNTWLHGGGTAQLGPADPADLIARRHAARRWWIGQAAVAPPGLVGLALSGGGIRSATFSLGVLQALARADRLAAIDILSTVSGGSYVGCFLRSLFLPKRLRGIAPVQNDAALSEQAKALELAAQYRFAMRALTSDASERALVAPSGKSVRNPIWWLREHSRYLAPNGPTDYSYAVAYLARNWLGMLYVFALGMAAVLAATALLDIGIVRGLAAIGWPWPSRAAASAVTGAAGCDLHLGGVVPTAVSAACRPDAPAAPPAFFRSFSPLVALALIPQLGSLAVSLAYWLTCQMSVNERDPRRQLGWFGKMAGWVALLAAALGALLYWRPLPFNPHIRWAERTGEALLGMQLAAGAIWLVATLFLVYPDQLLTAELRRRLTTWQARFNLAVLVLLGLGLVETLAAALRQWAWTGARSAALSISVGSALPVFAFAVRKLQGWAAGKGAKTGLFAAAARFLPEVALVAGGLAYGAVAVAAGALVQAAIWAGDPWQRGTVDAGATALLIATLAALGLLTGWSTGFINLSSLHNLYASRLTRAYLGASNLVRLETLEDPDRPDVTILDNHDKDYIQPETYGEADLPAPLHVINVTVNRTIADSSALVTRDRKGVPLSVEPHGIRLTDGARQRLLLWHRIGVRRYAESLSLGQWCAISGAAASSGMGRLTNLGFAMALTFANVRLGYWWWAPAAKPPQPARSPSRIVRALLGAPVYRLLSTFFYLFDEMTARYSSGYDRQYLSDGGHFENTGAYALIRRDVPLILVCDNAQDQDYAFADLENLVRTARIDLGRELVLLGGAALRRFLAEIGCRRATLFVDPDVDRDWKAAMRDGKGEAFALAFAVQGGAGVPARRLVLVKPRLLPGTPEDVAGYAAANPPFPQQTTGDQFFDEAQWESYRRLGEHCMTTLLAACPRLFAAAGVR